jgi:hypothetical protein
MKKSFSFIFILAIIGITNNSIGQQVIVTDDASYTTPATGTVLDIKSTTKGLIIPRMTSAQKTSLGNTTPINGVVIYDTDLKSFWYWDNSTWNQIAASNIPLTNIKFGDASNYSSFDADGTLFMYGSATIWDDILVPFSQARLGSASKPDFDYANVGLLFPQNDPSEKIYIVVQIPHSYKEGSDIFPHIHWQQTNASTPTWKMDYKWFNNNETVPASFTTISPSSVVNTYVSGNLAQISSFGSITGAANSSGGGLSPISKTISSLLLVVIYRDDNVVTGDVLGFQFDIHIERNSIGSHSAFAK